MLTVVSIADVKLVICGLVGLMFVVIHSPPRVSAICIPNKFIRTAPGQHTKASGHRIGRLSCPSCPRAVCR